MDNILGVISEYNPFHKGHLYHLEKTKELIDPDYSVCILGGNFTQRGEASLVDKWSKAEIALNSGFDLVLELPTVYATSSAENFAEGAIKILSSFGFPTTLSFGSECGDIDLLTSIADILIEEPKEYVSILNHELSKGISFPKARENAILMYLNDIKKYANILSSPNNTLGMEYIKAIKKLKSNVKPITIKRTSANYNSKNIKSRFPSATAIRDFILKGGKIEKLSPFLSNDTIELLTRKAKHSQLVGSLSSFENQIIYTLRRLSIEEISNLPDVSEGLEYKIKEAASSSSSLDELINLIKSKRYTQTRIQRILVYALLNITKKDMQIAYKTQPYIRVLAMNPKGKILLSRISHSNKKLPIITSVKKFTDKCTDKNIKTILEKDFFATDVFTLAYGHNSQANLDYTNKIIIQ